MSFHDTFNATKNLLVSRLQELGITNATTNMGWTTLLNLHVPTYLTITVPAKININTQLNITGHLQKQDNTRLANKTIKLKVNNQLTQITATTNNNGEYSLTYTPTVSGTYTFQTIYAGDNIHGETSSSIESRSTGKTTSIMLLNTPTWIPYTTNTPYSITALLSDNTPTVLTGETLTMELTGGTSTTNTGTTNNEGEYTVTNNLLTSNSNVNLTVTYAGRGDYGASTKTSTIYVGGTFTWTNITVNGNVVM